LHAKSIQESGPCLPRQAGAVDRELRGD
jgi:hypothetical protein